MQVDFHMTPADIRRAVGHMPMPRRKVFLFLAVANLAGAAIAYARGGPGNGLGSVQIFLFTSLIFVVCWLLFPAYIWRRIGRDLELLGPRRVTLTDDGLFHDDSGGRHRAPWSTLHGAETTESGRRFLRRSCPGTRAPRRG